MRIRSDRQPIEERATSQVSPQQCMTVHTCRNTTGTPGSAYSMRPAEVHVGSRAFVAATWHGVLHLRRTLYAVLCGGHRCALPLLPAVERPQQRTPVGSCVSEGRAIAIIALLWGSAVAHQERASPTSEGRRCRLRMLPAQQDITSAGNLQQTEISTDKARLYSSAAAVLLGSIVTLLNWTVRGRG